MNIREMQRHIEALRLEDDDAVLVYVGARGPNLDMPDGNVMAAVRVGNFTESAEAKYLDDAISLARAKALRAQEAHVEKMKKAKEKADADETVRATQ